MKKWNPSHTILAAATKKFDFILSFNKEDDNCWYVDIPYPFSHANLQMVCGADDFLEALSKGNRRVSVHFCDHDFEGCQHEWHAVKEEYRTTGCTYKVTSPVYSGKAWLCPVTLYVLGHFPKHIYISQIDETDTKGKPETAPIKKPKNVVLISHEPKSGKTTLAETLAEKNLSWQEEALTNEDKWHHASVEYNGETINISECFNLSDSNRELWQGVAERMEKADLVLYLVDSSMKFLQNENIDFLEDYISSKIDLTGKALLVSTKTDIDCISEINKWWESLSKEEQDSLNKRNLEDGNPNCKTYLQAILNEYGICLWGLLEIESTLGNPEEADVSCQTMAGIDELKKKIAKILFADC